MSPANCLRASADDCTISGASFVHSLVAPQVANRTSGLLEATNVLVGGSFDWIISAGVISRALETGAVVVQNADPSVRSTKRTNAQDRQAKRATGIEPAWPAWKAGTLPLSYARAKNKLPRHPIPAKLFLAPSLIRPLAIWIGGG